MIKDKPLPRYKCYDCGKYCDIIYDESKCEDCEMYFRETKEHFSHGDEIEFNQ